MILRLVKYWYPVEMSLKVKRSSPFLNTTLHHNQVQERRRYTGKIIRYSLRFRTKSAGIKKNPRFLNFYGIIALCRTTCD